MPRPQQQPVDVLVVGGGPVGLTAANLLAAYGTRVVLVERNPTTSDEPKAISLDDESIRTLQLCDLAAEVHPIVVPGTGTRYYGADGRALVHARGAVPFQFGHAFKNQFAQPELERVLLAGLRKREQVTIRLSTTLVNLVQDDTGVEAVLRSDAGEDRLRAAYVLGCDGGRSTVRQLSGISMSGKSFQVVWLVVDTLDDPHNERFGMHHGDPRRPHVIVPGRGGRCRYEFLLYPGEGAAGEPPAFDLMRRLVAPYRDLQPHQVERSVNYTFNALVARRWRHHRAFLLGDAAHMMPPFAGQGLNSGIRDAANLCWKIAAAAHGRAGDALLDSYERERLPHARATVKLSVVLGDVVMTTNPKIARIRDALVWAAVRTPWGAGYLGGMRYRPSPTLHQGFVAELPGGDRAPLLGRAFEQPRVLLPDGHAVGLLDEVLGKGFAILGVAVPASAWASVSGSPLRALEAAELDVLLDDRLPRAGTARRAVGDVDGRLQRLLAPYMGRFIVLRPDRYVCAVLRPDQALAVGRRLVELLGCETQPALAESGI